MRTEFMIYPIAVLLTSVVVVVTPKLQRRRCLVDIVLLLVTGILLAVAFGVRRFTDVDMAPVLFVGRWLLLCSFGRSLFMLVTASRWTARFFSETSQIIRDVVQVLIYTTALLITLHIAGVEPSSLLTSSAVIGAALGFLMKDTLGNIFAGLAIQLDQPFRVGDWIQFDADLKHIGEVVQVNWRATKVITLDKIHITVPNAALSQALITNYSQPTGISRRSIYVIAPYDVETHKVHAIILKALDGMQWLASEIPTTIVTNAFTERGIEYWVRIFTREFHIRDRVDGEARDRIWYAFHRHGIDMPPIQQEIRGNLTQSPVEEQAETQRLDRHRRLLRNVDFLHDLPEPALNSLAHHAEELLFGAGQPIIRQGERTSEFYVLISGKVEVSVSHDSQPSVSVGSLIPPQFFGEMSLLTGESRSATVTAVAPSSCLMINKPVMSEVLQSQPELAQRMCEVLSQRRQLKDQVVADAKDSFMGIQAKTGNDMLNQLREFFGLKG